MTARGAELDLEAALRRAGWGARLQSYRRLLAGASRSAAADAPRISIVVIAWRLNPDTVKSFRVLQSQPAASELIFVNNGAGEREFDVLEPFADVSVRLRANAGACGGRNLGAAFARAPLLLFLEDDGIPSPGLVAAHLDAFRKYDVIAVRGVITAKTDNPLNRLAAHYYLGDRPFPVFADIEGNTSYNAELFYRAGGWDEQLRYGREGLELSRRLTELEPDRRKQIYAPGPLLSHDYAPDEAHLEIKLARHRRATTLLRARYPDYDEYLASWDRYRGRDDLLIRRAAPETA
ncbi:MAG: glycosyltransferase [Chlamydiota bacterium]